MLKYYRFIYFCEVRLSLFKENCFIWFNESSLKMMKISLYFILKTVFFLKMFEFLS